MTSYQGKRCAHCRSTYRYQASGHGCGDSLNDGRYCPTCKAAVTEALSALPILFERRYFTVPTVPVYADVTRESIVEWEADLRRRRAEGLVAQRIWPGLINLETGDQQHIRQVVASNGPHRGTPFRVSSWTSNPDDMLIEVGLEWDLVKQARGGLWSGD